MKRSIFLAASFLVLGMIMACASNTGSKETAAAKSSTESQMEKVAIVIELTSEDFNKKVYDLKNGTSTYLGNKPAIVDFNATWCGPCRRIAPILQELALEYADQIVIYKVDVDNCRDIANAFNITSIPAILYIPMNGEPQMTVGSRSKEQFKQEINTILLQK